MWWVADGWAEGLGFLYAVDDSLRNEALVAAVDNDDRRRARRLRPPYLIEHPPHYRASIRSALTTVCTAHTEYMSCFDFLCPTHT